MKMYEKKTHLHWANISRCRYMVNSSYMNIVLEKIFKYQQSNKTKKYSLG